MADYLTDLPSFTVRATNTLQVMLVSGEKLDFEAVSDVSVRRPDRVRTRRTGVAVNADFYYDGKTVTVFDRTTNFFTVNEAPPSIDGMLADCRICSVSKCPEPTYSIPTSTTG